MDNYYFLIKSILYSSILNNALELIPYDQVEVLANSLVDAWANNRQVFIFGNGGSAGNAIHLANDFLYGVSRRFGHALRVNALPANSAVLTCLANDVGYEEIYRHQLGVLAQNGDIAIALSGSGNSPNILKALEYCSEFGIKSFAILGYSGGAAKNITNYPIHIPIDDMQISEDLQLVIGHMLMQYLYGINQSINSNYIKD
jgi:D-sedoheptulose 7-phosphate isomerase